MPRQCYVYILANWRRVLYIGVTGHIHRRLQQHGAGKGSRFVAEHRLRRLVYIETFPRALDAIAREKQLKGWVRRRKVALIAARNPQWRDLSAEWGWRPALDSSVTSRTVP